jgi:hypothetical protein
MFQAWHAQLYYTGDRLYVGTATGNLFIYDHQELSGTLLLDAASPDMLISIPRQWSNFGRHQEGSLS